MKQTLKNTVMFAGFFVGSWALVIVVVLAAKSVGFLFLVGCVSLGILAGLRRAPQTAVHDDSLEVNL